MARSVVRFLGSTSGRTTEVYGLIAASLSLAIMVTLATILAYGDIGATLTMVGVR